MNWRQLTNLPVIWILRSPLHRPLSHSVLLMTVEGRKSGRRYTFPVNYISDKDDLLVVSRPNRTWWRNLGGGAQAHLLLGGRRYTAQGEVLTDPDAKGAALIDLARKAPNVAKRLGVDLPPVNADTEPRTMAAASGDLVLVRLSKLKASNLDTARPAPGRSS